MIHQNILSGYEKPSETVVLRKDDSTFIIEIQGKVILCDRRDWQWWRSDKQNQEKLALYIANTSEAIALINPQGCFSCCHDTCAFYIGQNL